jgi:hypothetical protein
MAEIPRRPETSKRTHRVNRPRFEPIGKCEWKTDSASRHSIDVVLVRIPRKKIPQKRLLPKGQGGFARLRPFSVEILSIACAPSR